MKAWNGQIFVAWTFLELFICYCILPEIVRKDPAVNQVHLRRLEEYQIDETAKRRQDVRAIEEKMREIDERSRKNRQKM